MYLHFPQLKCRTLTNKNTVLHWIGSLDYAFPFLRDVLLISEVIA